MLPGHGKTDGWAWARGGGEGSCHLAHLYPLPAAQVVASGRGSLSSDARTSWDSGCPAPASTCTSHSLPESSAPSTAGCPARPPPVSICWGWTPWHTCLVPQGKGLCSFRPLYGERAPGNLLEGLWFSQEQANPGCTSVGGHRAKLRRGGGSRSPRNKARAERPGPAALLHLDLTKVGQHVDPGSRHDPPLPPTLHLPGLLTPETTRGPLYREGRAWPLPAPGSCVSCLLPTVEPRRRP